MSQREKVKSGDVVELGLRFKVHSIEHFEADTYGPAFTALTYAAGEPGENGKVNLFTFEVPDEFGRIVILAENDDES